MNVTQERLLNIMLVRTLQLGFNTMGHVSLHAVLINSRFSWETVTSWKATTARCSLPSRKPPLESLIGGILTLLRHKAHIWLSPNKWQVVKVVSNGRIPSWAPLDIKTMIYTQYFSPLPPWPMRWCSDIYFFLKSYFSPCWTHLDLDVLAVDDLYDADNIIEHQPHFLTAVWWMETNIASVSIWLQLS